MKRSVIETVLGAVVLVLAGFFLVFSYKTADVRHVSGYEIKAAFSGTGGLAMGDDVRISGVKVGSVNRLQLDPKNFLAVVSMSIDPNVALPDDTAAIISSDSLLGGRYLELQPGASDTNMKDGDRIQYTQAPQNLEELLGKFIFSMGSKDKKDGDSAASPSSAANSANSPAPASNAAPLAAGMPLLSDKPVHEKPAAEAKSVPEAEAQDSDKAEQPKTEKDKAEKDGAEKDRAETGKGLTPEDTAAPAQPVLQPVFESSGAADQAHP